MAQNHYLKLCLYSTIYHKYYSTTSFLKNIQAFNKIQNSVRNSQQGTYFVEAVHQLNSVSIVLCIFVVLHLFIFRCPNKQCASNKDFPSVKFSSQLFNKAAEYLKCSQMVRQWYYIFCYFVLVSLVKPLHLVIPRKRISKILLIS